MSCLPRAGRGLGAGGPVDVDKWYPSAEVSRDTLLGELKPPPFYSSPRGKRSSFPTPLTQRKDDGPVTPDKQYPHLHYSFHPSSLVGPPDDTLGLHPATGLRTVTREEDMKGHEGEGGPRVGSGSSTHRYVGSTVSNWVPTGTPINSFCNLRFSTDSSSCASYSYSLWTVPCSTGVYTTRGCGTLLVPLLPSRSSTSAGMSCPRRTTLPAKSTSS